MHLPKDTKIEQKRTGTIGYSPVTVQYISFRPQMAKMTGFTDSQGKCAANRTAQVQSQYQDMGGNECVRAHIFAHDAPKYHF